MARIGRRRRGGGRWDKGREKTGKNADMVT